MIYDNSSKNAEIYTTYMGSVNFIQFRNTAYYQVEIIKDAEKERFLREQGLPVKTTSQILNNWRSTGMTKFMNGTWYVKGYVLLNVEHEFRHQNYNYKTTTCIGKVN